MRRSSVLWSQPLLLAVACLSLNAQTSSIQPVTTAEPHLAVTMVGSGLKGTADIHRAVTFASVPMQFEPNCGQNATSAKYIARGAGYSLRLEELMAVLDFDGNPVVGSNAGATAKPGEVRLAFEGANQHAAIEGESKSITVNNYLPTGDPATWHSGIPTYERVIYKELYRGIDVSFYGNGHRLEYDVMVAPGSDPKTVRLALAGANTTRLDTDGNLLMIVNGREVRLLKPQAYQQGADGRRKTVDVAFVLDGGSNKSIAHAAFKVGSYDRSQPLVIDPVVDYSFHVPNAAGSGTILVSASATDAAGNTYIAGNLYNNLNIFIAKFNASGQQIFNTVLGTNVYPDTYPSALAFDAAGDVYVTGYAYASGSSWGFPTTSNAYQQTAPSNGYYNAYLAVLKYDGSALTYSTFLNGTNIHSYGDGVAVDSSGNAYVSGQAGGAGFPTTTGALQTTFPSGANYTGFVSKINPSASGASSLVYSTLLGSNVQTYLQHVAVDTAGNAYVTGATYGSGFPVTAGAYQYSGLYPATSYTNAFVSKLNASGSALVYSSLLGPGIGNGIAIDGNDDVYVTGQVGGADFPTSSGAYQTKYPGGFVTELNPQASALVYSTFLGGPSSGVTESNVIVGDITLTPGCASSCNAYVSGYTTATDFPAINPIQNYVPGTGGDYAFLAELNGTGSQALFSSYFATGPAASLNLLNGTYGPLVGVDSGGSMYLTGGVTGGGLTVTQPTSGNAGQGFLAKIGPASAANVVSVPVSVVFAAQPVGTSTTQQGTALPTVLVENLGSAAATISSITFQPAGEFTETDNCNGSVAGGGYCTLTLSFLPTMDGAQSSTLTINSSGGNPTVALTGTGNSTGVLQATPSSLSFPSTATNAKSAAQIITLQNVGIAPVTSISYQNSATSEYAVSSNCPTTLNPSQSCQISVVFQPLQPGYQSGTIYVYGSNNDLTIPIGGTATGSSPVTSGTVSLNPGAINFGTELQGVASSNVYMAVYNTGAVPVTVNSTAITLTSSIGKASDFSLNSYQCGVPPFQVAAGGSCYLYISFTPSAAGTETATLTLSDSSTTTGTLTANLVGIGLAASQTLEFTPGNTVFPDQPIGIQSAVQTFYVFDTGTAPVTIDRALVTGDFQITYTSCNAASVNPESEPGSENTYCYVQVAFTPTALGARTGTLTLVDAATGNPQVLSLTGNGIAATGTLVVDQSSLTFAPQAVGTTSATQYVYITNPGDSSITVNSFTTTGDFALTPYGCPTPPFAIAAGAQCNVALTFTPTSTTNPRTGTVTIGSTAGNQTISLSGSGEAASRTIAFTPGSTVNFGSIPIGTQSYGVTVYVRNTGTESVTFTSAAALTGAYTMSDSCTYGTTSYTLAAQASCSIIVYLTPTATGTAAGTLKLVDNAGTQTLTLTGVGIAASTAVDMNAQTLTFTQQTINTTSNPQYFYFYNYGASQTVTVKSLAITGTNATDFVIYQDQCTGTAVGPGGACYVYVEFAPKTSGALPGTITFTDTTNKTYTETLAGYSPANSDAGQLTPNALSYPGTVVGVYQTGSAYGNLLTFTNNGDSPLTIGTLTGTNYGGAGEFGPDPGWYADQCSGVTLQPAGACNVGVEFTPSATGARTGSVIFPVTYFDNTTANFSATLTGTGIAQKTTAVLSTTAASFLDQVVGIASAYVETIYLTNTGNLPLKVGTLAGTNFGTGEFSTNSTLGGYDSCTGATVAAAGQCQINVVFKPTSTAAQTGTVNFPVTYSGASSAVNLTAALSGNGVAVSNSAYVTPTTTIFPAQVLSTTSTYQYVSLVNSSNAPAKVGTVTGTNYGGTSEFTVLDGASSGYDGCSGVTLAAGATCNVYVVFTPTVAGSRTGSMKFPVTYFGASSAVTILETLGGTGVAVANGIQLGQTAVTFPSEQLNTTSPQIQVQVVSANNSPVTSVVLGGTNPGDFTEGDNCAGSTAPCVITLTFTPTATGTRKATVTETDPGTGSPRTITLTGTGIAAGSGAALYPTALSFSTTQSVGVGTTPQSFSVTNTGSGSLTISSVTTTDAAEFPIAQNACAGLTLTQGQSCLITVLFSPTSTGAHTATIKVTDNAPGSPQSLAVSGTSVADVGSTVTVVASPSSAATGALVALTATVLNSSSAPVNNGAVTFYAGSAVLGTVQVVTTTSGGGTIGNATLYTRSLPLGANSITAKYVGADLPGTSAAITATITGKYNSSNTLTSTGVQGSYALTSAVSGLGPVVASGSVLFTDTQTNTNLGTATVSTATAAQSFYTSSTPALLASPNPVGLVDVNSDGKPDLVAGYYYNSGAQVTVSLGNGDGTFQPPTNLETAYGSVTSLAFGDVNGDGKVDIVDASANGVEVFLGNGNGTFKQGVSYGSGAFQTVQLADVNGDGKLDILVSDSNNSSVDVMLGNGDGTFQDQQNFPSGSGTSWIVVGDFNGDGKVDVATNATNGNFYAINILLGNGNGTFQAAQSVATTGYYPYQLAVGDVNGDGKLDIITNDDNNQIGVLLGKGTGAFQAEQYVLTGASYNNPLLADTNGDGKLDIIASNANSGLLYVALGNGDGTFKTPVGYPTGSSPYFSAVGDLNSDGKPDIVVANYQSSSATVLLNQIIDTATLTGVRLPGSGSDTVTATYSGDTNYLSSVSNVLTLASNAGTGSTTLAVSPTSGALGTVFTMTASPLNSAQAPVTGGTITFFDGSVQLGTVEIVSSGTKAGTATLLTRSLLTGSNSISARFNGTDSNQASISSDVSVTVTGLYPTTTSITSSGVQGSYTLSAIVDGFGSGNPTGSVAFKDVSTSTTLGTVNLNSLTLTGTLSPTATLSAGNNARWVVTGDFNGDGRPDLAAVNYSSNTVSIFIGNGDGTFLAQQTYATGSSPSVLVTGDFNADGKLDLAITNASGSTVGILLGNGDGTFQTQVTYAVGSSPYAIATADLNGDGKLDLIVPNANGNTVSILLGNGDGTFQAQTTFTVGNYPQGVAIGDFNGDGKPDLAVSNYDDSTISILIGNGDGTFETQATFPCPSNPITLAIGDLNGDGKLDLAAAGYGSSDVVVLLGNGDGTFGTATSFAAGSGIYSVVLADVNGDSKLDAVVANYGTNTASILLGNGNGTFQAQQTYITGRNPSSVAVADLNGDGRPDVVTANYSDSTLSVLLGADVEAVSLSGVTLPGSGADIVSATYSGDTNYATSTSSTLSLPSTPLGTTTTLTATPASGVLGSAFTLSANVKDASSNAVTYGSVSFYNGSNLLSTVQLLDQTSSLGSAGTASLITKALATGSDSIKAVFNGTDIDSPSTSAVASVTVTGQYATTTSIASTGSVGNYTLTGTVEGFSPLTPTGNVNFTDTTSNVSLGSAALNAATAGYSFIAAGTPTAGSNPYSISIADMNNDQKQDLIVGNYDGTMISVLLGNGDGTYQTAINSGTNFNGVYELAIGDFNGDGKQDVVTANGSSAGIFLGNGDGTFATEVDYPTGGTTVSVAVGDFNHDGKLDFVTANSGGTLSVLLGNGDGTFQAQKSYAAGNCPQTVVVGDFNGDDKLDVAVTNECDGTVGIYLGNGDGTLQTAQPFATGVGDPYGEAVGDFNGDGKLDVAVTSDIDGSGSQISVLLGNGDGTFQAGVTSAVGNDPRSVAAGDVNGDGKLDLVVGNTADNTVGVLLGNGNGTFATQTTYASQYPYSVAIGDLNNDSRLDFAVANYNGVNTASAFLSQLSETATLASVIVPGTGTHNVTATYVGDTNFTTSTSSSIQLAASLATSTITLTPSPSATVAYAQALSVLVTVSSQAGVNTPTGNISYTIDGGTAQQATLSGGSVTLNLNGLAVGSHSLVVNYAGDQIHATATQTLAITVTKAPQTITFNPISNVTYGVSPFAVSPTSTSGLAVTVKVVSGPATVSSNTVTVTGVGTVKLEADQAGTTSYNAAAAVQQTFTVNPAPLTVTVANATKVYGNANPTFTSTTTGLVGSDTITVTLATTATTSSAVGTYPITATLSGAALANYTPTVNSGTLTVTTMPLTVTANNATRVYGAANPTFTGTTTGLQNGDTVTVTYATTATASSAVGSYSIVPTVSGSALSNYTLTTVNGTLSVTAAPLTVTVNNASRTYGASNPTFTGTSAGLLNGDTVTVTYSTTATATSVVGTYPITATVSGAAASNYTTTVNAGTLTVTQAPLTIAVNSISKVYGSTNPTFSGTVTGLQNGDGITTTYSTTATQYSSVGGYPITATISGAAASNYSLTVTPGTLTITQAILQIAPNNATRVYGASNPTFTGTVTGILNNDNVVTTYSTTATVTTYVGSYPITATISGTAAGNYNPQVTPGSLSITPAPLAVSVNASTKVYGAALPSFTTTYTTLLNGDVLTPTYSTTATTSSAVGSYSVTETLAGAALVNYTPTYTAGTLTVTVAPLSLTVANASRTYGAANPTFTGTLTGVVNGDTITPTYSTTAVVTSPVGTYPITATLAGANLSNYTQTITSGTLTVTPAPLAVTVANASRIYGAANPTFTGTTTGLLNGDTVTVTYSSTATMASPAGSYPITAVVSGSASSNYTSTVTPGTFTVSQATLTIVVNNATRVYQAANPTFTGTVSGLLNGDTVTVTYTTTATASSPVGSYPITATISGSAASNYSPSVTPGSLSITALQTAAPVIAPAAGTYTSAQSVTITDATAGATIYYAINAAPTTSSPVYTGPITVSTSETVEALALGSGSNYSQSVVTSAAYTINPAPTATPVISPAGGSYVAPQAITITDATAGSTIYYTTNGTAPTTASTAYTGPFSIGTSSSANGAPIVVEAIAVSSGAANSAIASNSYMLATPAPVFNPTPGAYSSAQSITLSSAAGAVIHYTTDGSKPTTSSPTYTKAIPFTSGTLTISALAHVTNEYPSAIATGTYTTATPAATPTFSPVAGTYTAIQSVAIADATAGSTIYYTTNGTTPTTSSSVYTGPITVSASETIEAIATATSYANSAVASAAYTITLPAATPTISPASGIYTSAQSVTIADATPGVTIYYAINGTPTTSSAVYSGPLTVSATESVSAIASGNGYSSSPVASASYTISSTVTTPVISPAGGSYIGPQTVTIADGTMGATIYYTTNGTVPTTASTAYTGPITISTSSNVNGAPIVVEAIAVANGATNSSVASNSYMIATPAAAFSPAPGAYPTSQSITLSSETGAVIHYTTDGSKPTTSSPTYSKPIAFTTGTLTISALAHLSGQYASAISTGTYTIATPAATPTFSPAAGSYTSTQSVAIADATSGATIYYTTNGSTPTTSSSVYTGPIVVATSETINAIATASGSSQSAIGSAAYTITLPAATPVISPAGGTYTGTQSVTIADSSSGATIYYAINGTPTTSSTVYTGPITVSASETISAIAGGAGFSSSSVATASFTISTTAATPVISPAAGSYFGPQTVTITDTTSGTAIYYTTNGTTPTTASTQYTGPFIISTSSNANGAPIVVEAIAVATGVTNSTAASSSYMIATAAPAFSPAPGNYTSTQSITLTSTAGAVIHYTTDGSKPTTSSPTYSKPIQFTSGTLTISAFAHTVDQYSSPIVTGTYTMTQ